MTSKSTRTIAALVAGLAAVAAIVAWVSRPSTPSVFEPGDREVSAGMRTNTEPLSKEPPKPSEQNAPVVARPATLEEGNSASSRESAPKTKPVDLVVVVTDPTNSIDDDRKRGEGRVVPERGLSIRSWAPQGKYSYSVEPGRVLFLLHQPGFKPVERWFDLKRDEPVHREEIVLEPTWRLRINLLVKGGKGLCNTLHEMQDPMGRIKAAAPLTLTACVDAPGHVTDVGHVKRNEWLFQFWSDEQWIDIVDDPPVHVTLYLGNRVLATRRLDARVPEITFTIEPEELQAQMSRLALQLADAYTAGPVEGVQAILVDSTGVQDRATSGPDGRVSFLPQAPGKYRLDIDWEGKFLTSREVELLPGETTDLGTLSLTAGVEISGRFSDADETPERTWFVGFYSEDGETGAPASRHLFPVPSTGRFSTFGFAPGRYVLSAVSRKGLDEERPGPPLGISGPVIIDTREKPARELVIEMHEFGYLRLRPRIADFADYTCSIRTRDGGFCGTGRLHDWLGDRLMAPGSYLLTVTRLDEIVARIPFDVAASTITLDVP